MLKRTFANLTIRSCLEPLRVSRLSQGIAYLAHGLSERKKKNRVLNLRTQYLCIPVGLEKTRDISVVVDVDTAGGWNCRKSRKGHDVAGLRDNESCTVAEANRCNTDCKSGWSAEFVRIVG